MRVSEILQVIGGCVFNGPSRDGPFAASSASPDVRNVRQEVSDVVDIADGMPDDLRGRYGEDRSDALAETAAGCPHVLREPDRNLGCSPLV